MTRSDKFIADIRNNANLAMAGMTVVTSAVALAIDTISTRPAPVVTPIQWVLARLG